MSMRTPLTGATVLAATLLLLAGCGNGGGGGGGAAAVTPSATTKVVNDQIANATTDTAAPIPINPISFSNTLDRSDTAEPIAVD